MIRMIAGVLLFLVAAYVGFAAFSIHRIGSGFATRDVGVIAQSIDGPAVKESLKTQLDAVVRARSDAGLARQQDVAGRFGAGLVAALAPALVNNLVDTLITPQGLARLLAAFETQNAGGNGGGSAGFSTYLRQIRPTSLTSLQLVDGRGGALTLTFENFAWRITDISVPPQFFEKIAP